MPKQPQTMASAKILILSNCEIWELLKEKAQIKLTAMESGKMFCRPEVA